MEASLIVAWAGLRGSPRDGEAWRRIGPGLLRARLTCSGLKDGPSTDMPTQNLHMWSHLEKVFADVIKDFKMRSCWMVQLGPRSNGKCPYRREDRGGENQRRPYEDGGRDWTYRQPQTKECLESPEAGRSKEEFSPIAIRGSIGTSDALILDFWPPETGESKCLLL